MIKEGTRLYINITDACNTDCPFCCMYSSTKNALYMQFDTYRRIIDSCEGNFELQLEGGEPLLHPDLYLFIEYAISTKRCTKVIILTNGIEYGKHLKRLVAVCKWNKIPFETKISANYWLIQQDPEHLKKIARWIFATEFIQDFSILLNVRKREGDEWIDDEIEKLKISQYANSFYLQSYGKMTGTKYDKPVIVQNIQNWRIYATDGACFGQDLVARSEYEKELIDEHSKVRSV